MSQSWRVEGGRFVLPDGTTMTGACHHRTGGACGGCYARAVEALRRISEGDATTDIAFEVVMALRDEGEKLKAQRRRAGR